MKTNCHWGQNHTRVTNHVTILTDLCLDAIQGAVGAQIYFNVFLIIILIIYTAY